MIKETKKFEADLEALINNSGLPITIVRLALDRMALIVADSERRIEAREAEQERTEEETNEHKGE